MKVEDIDNEPLIAWMHGELAKNPASAVRSRLTSILFRRGQMRGNLADFDEAIRSATIDIDRSPDSTTLLVRARARTSLHRFADAEKDIALARKYPGGNTVEAAMLQADIDLSNGKYLAARDAYVKVLAQTQDPGAMIALANLEFELGNATRADELFEQSLPLIPPGSKTWIAWFESQRGMRYLESGELDLAKARFAKALELDPRSFIAQHHMAAVEAKLGDVDGARKRYEEVIAQSHSGELMSALATLEKGAGREAEAKALVEQAKAEFEKSLALYPEATWQHMGYFLLDQGLELVRARDMLAKNAAARPNVSSWLALAEAQLVTGDAKAAAKTIDKAVATPVRLSRLHWTAAAVYEAAGRKTDAAAQRAKAEALTPAPAPAPVATKSP